MVISTVVTIHRALYPGLGSRRPKYRPALPLYTNTQPVYYVDLVKRYVDSQQYIYTHDYNMSDHVNDHATNDGRAKGMASR